MKPLVVNITTSEPRLYEWCDRCLTSAQVSVDALMLTGSGISKLKTFTYCQRCDREES